MIFSILFLILGVALGFTLCDYLNSSRKGEED